MDPAIVFVSCVGCFGWENEGEASSNTQSLGGAALLTLRAGAGVKPVSECGVGVR